MIRRLPLAAILISLLSACAGATHWVKAGGTAEQAQADYSACRAEARRVEAASSRREAIVAADRSTMDAARGVERDRLAMRDEVAAYSRRRSIDADADGCMARLGWRKGDK